MQKNIYQEALNFLTDHCYEVEEEYDLDENCSSNYRPLNDDEIKQYIDPLKKLIERYTSEQIALLKELVEKEIPKEPDYEGDGYADGYMVYDTWICPNCGKKYEVDYQEYNRCPECGQLIDWSRKK